MGFQNFTGGPPNIGPNGPGGTGVPGAPSTGQHQGSYDPLDFLIDYNKKFANAGVTMFRDAVVQQVMGVLIGKKKPNCLLIGPAGVGKTKIVEDLAYRIEIKDPLLPDRLRNAVIYELPLSNIISGTQYRGLLEEKLKCVLDYLKSDKRYVLFIDEIHQLCNGSETYTEIAQILKPALARGDIKCIGATTSQEANSLMDDPALNRRFSRLIVDEFDKSQTVEILKTMRPEFVMHYDNKIAVSDDIMGTVVDLADEYRSAGSHRPDNAITLLDRAIGDAVVARKASEKLAANDPVMLAAIQAVPFVTVTEKQIRSTAMKLMTGNAKRTDFDRSSMAQALSVIKGQDDVIEILLDALQRLNLNLFPRTKPATFLFAGASGVGKTEVTKIIAKQLTGVRPIILNMTEYHSSASINRIIGSPAGYVGSDSNAELPFDCLESNPYQVILLDEFEKGDKSVQRLFMSAFDEGYIKTNRGKTVDFSRSIIIATTNAGHTDVSAGARIGFSGADPAEKAMTQTPRGETAKRLEAYFDTELLNRFKEIITFHSLSRGLYREILEAQYKTMSGQILAARPRTPIPASIPGADLDEIVERTYVPEFGARPAAHAVQDYIETAVIKNSAPATLPMTAPAQTPSDGKDTAEDK